MRVLSELGYEAPTAIQEKTIPALLEGRDLIGQAQTGTGKTAAFSLPILDRIDLKRSVVQALILTPTRELAIQVSEAVHRYARHVGRLKVMPVYGGDSIGKQIGHLKSGMHVIAGTPGRIMDHLRRGTLDFNSLRVIVLDEADEMLRMGFLEDIEWILEQAPEKRQTALFSATMPRDVKRIAERYLDDPITVQIGQKTMTVPTVEQQYIHVAERQKLDALTHLLETEKSADGEAILIFARTKLGAADLTEKLQARGYAAEAMHGDMSQVQRESVIRRMKAGQVEIVVATDVAARGLDVEHLSHVINFDMPNDPEAYVHRIGRTARAGRAGKAILFVTPRDNRMLRVIESYTGKRLTPARVPTKADVAARRVALFKGRILKSLVDDELEIYLSLVEELAEESGRDMAEIAAALARLASGDKPLVAGEPEPAAVSVPEGGVSRLVIDVGGSSGVRPSDIVGAIANETGIPGNAIGAIDVHDDFTVVDIPAQYRNQVLTGMQGVRLRGQSVTIRQATDEDLAASPGRPRRPDGFRGKSRGPAGPFRKERPGAKWKPKKARDADGGNVRPDFPARKRATAPKKHKRGGPSL